VPIECIDCASKPEEAAAAIETAPAIWVPGGNTFFLAHHMRASGAACAIRRRVLEDGVLYVGCSAGSIVAGCSIRPAFWKGMCRRRPTRISSHLHVCVCMPAVPTSRMGRPNRGARGQLSHRRGLRRAWLVPRALLSISAL
jgi:hypothetical protein